MEEAWHTGGDGAIPPAGPAIHDDLTDALSGGDAVAVAWRPASPLVVLGRSNDVNREVDLERARREDVPVLRRRGGGGAVVLDPGTVCVTAAWPRPKTFSPHVALARIVESIRDALSGLGIDVDVRGTGDLAVGGRKVAGASLAVDKRGVLFQTSLLVDADLARIARLLRHPSREPEYRAGRTHAEFLTTLAREGTAVDAAVLGATMAGACRSVRLAAAVVGARHAVPLRTEGRTDAQDGIR